MSDICGLGILLSRRCKLVDSHAEFLREDKGIFCFINLIFVSKIIRVLIFLCSVNNLIPPIDFILNLLFRIIITFPI
jgi:hypothetical protein